MLARSSIAGLVGTIALALATAPDAPHYTLESTGAVRVTTTGTDATIGISADPVGGRPILAIALGATRGDGALLLHTVADERLRPGRYPVATTPSTPRTGRLFHPCFIPGSSDKPLGFFMGEQGWVTITAVEGARVSGSYEMRARGFLATNPKEENRWVTVRGTFVAVCDSTVTGAEALSSLTR